MSIQNPAVLFINARLFSALCDQFSVPESGLRQTDSKETTVGAELAAVVRGITPTLTGSRKRERSVEHAPGSATVLQGHLDLFWSALPRYPVPDGSKGVGRYIRIDGRATWRRRPNDEQWLGDLAVLGSGSTPDLLMELAFEHPALVDAVPLNVHGLHVTTILWCDTDALPSTAIQTGKPVVILLPTDDRHA